MLRRAVSGPDVYDPREAYSRLLQLYPRPAVRSPLSAHPRLVLAAGRVSRQSPSRSVYDLVVCLHSVHDLTIVTVCRPVESQFGAPRELRSLTGPPAGCLTPEGSRGPSDTAGPGVAYPLTLPLLTVLTVWNNLECNVVDTLQISDVLRHRYYRVT